MSTINNALSKLAEQQSSSKQSMLGMSKTLVRASITPVKSSRLVWAVGGFTLSLGLGAWAVTSAPEPIQTSLVAQDTQLVQPVAVTSSQNRPSNTSKLVEPVHTTIYESPKVAVAPAPAKVKPVSPAPVSKTAHVSTTAASSQAHQSAVALHSKPANNNMVLASTNTKPTTSVASTESSMQVVQVELSHRQMADKAVDRANKALEANDFPTASSEFQTALRYVPEDENIRRKIAALYYGNGQARKAADLLEEGIKRNKNSTALRMSLAGILLKEDQAKAALNVLGYIPDDVTEKYLAMRAALAQKLKQNEWAKQSYEMLTQRDPENGRWWLGLAIQQERSAERKKAKDSYTKALTMVGLSSQSQSFIRDRIAVLTSLEQGED